VLDEAIEYKTLKDFGQKVEVGDRTITCQIILWQACFLEKRSDNSSFERSGKSGLRQRLRRVVIGGSRGSRQDLRSLVGKTSREQVESVEASMIFFTSARVAGEKLVRGGGGTVGRMCGEDKMGLREDRSRVILSEKNWRNVEGRSERGIDKGSLESEERLSKVFNVDQSL